MHAAKGAKHFMNMYDNASVCVCVCVCVNEVVKEYDKSVLMVT